jgi:hypothetical protein
MDGVRVVGRGLHEPCVSLTAYADRCVIRIDCAANPEFWLELSLTPDALLDLVERCHAVEPQHSKTIELIKAMIGQKP